MRGWTRRPASPAPTTNRMCSGVVEHDAVGHVARTRRPRGSAVLSAANGVLRRSRRAGRDTRWTTLGDVASSAAASADARRRRAARRARELRREPAVHERPAAAQLGAANDAALERPPRPTRGAGAGWNCVAAIGATFVKRHSSSRAVGKPERCEASQRRVAQVAAATRGPPAATPQRPRRQRLKRSSASCAMRCHAVRAYAASIQP